LRPAPLMRNEWGGQSCGDPSNASRMDGCRGIRRFSNEIAPELSGIESVRLTPVMDARTRFANPNASEFPTISPTHAILEIRQALCPYYDPSIQKRHILVPMNPKTDAMTCKRHKPPPSLADERQTKRRGGAARDCGHHHQDKRETKRAQPLRRAALEKNELTPWSS